MRTGPGNVDMLIFLKTNYKLKEKKDVWTCESLEPPFRLFSVPSIVEIFPYTLLDVNCDFFNFTLYFTQKRPMRTEYMRTMWVIVKTNV